MITFWAAVLGISVLLYVMLDGFDLGTGIIFGFTRDENRRRSLLMAIEPLWDGNETWLVVTGVVLWGAFPVVYATLLSAFYLPLLAMLAGLILRGVAFEFRTRAKRTRRLWDASFAAGSFIAAFMQGAAVGALVEGLPFVDRQYAGGDFGWFSPFALLCGLGLCVGYALLGASWLTYKGDSAMKEAAYPLLRYLAAALLVFLLVVFGYALNENLEVLGRWATRPYLLALPVIGIIASATLLTDLRGRWALLPFLAAAAIFMAAFGTLAVSFWPYMIPYSITIEEAASPRSSLAFMFWGAGLFVFPLMLAYLVFSYVVFRGRVPPSSEDY